METTIKTNQSKVARATVQSVSVQSNFWNNVEFNRYGIISMLVIAIGCIGGIAASFGAGAETMKLAMIAFPSIIALAMVLAVAPMKTIVYTSAFALVLDMLVFIF